MSSRPDDEGTIMILTLGFVMLAMALIVVVADASSVFLARRALLDDCDSAALQAAQQLDVATFYGRGADDTLPLDPQDVARVVSGIDPALSGSTDGTTITVEGRRQVRLPFMPSLSGLVPQTVTATATCTTVAHRR